MQWQLILKTTMHAFDINALLTMIAINKLTDRTRKNSFKTNDGLPEILNMIQESIQERLFPVLPIVTATVNTHIYFFWPHYGV